VIMNLFNQSVSKCFFIGQKWTIWNSKQVIMTDKILK
jgi:hypothetical protein